MMRCAAALIVVAAARCAVDAAAPSADRVLVISPRSQLRFELRVVDGRLSHTVVRDGTTVIEPSALGIAIDGVNLGEAVEIGAIDNYRVSERYPWRGVHAQAINEAHGARVTVVHRASARRYGVDVRAYDDGAAFRIVVPGEGTRVPDAASAFTLPAGATVWSHGLRDHYEAQYDKRRIEDIPSGEWAAPPVTARLAANAGYVAITESDLRGYAGMVLQADGGRVLRERLAHAAPVGYPFTLRYGDEEGRRLARPAAIAGAITTPWRVILAARDLNTLVNSDIVSNLAAPPDPALFPQGAQTPWLKPGRAVWRYLDGGDNTFEGIKDFSRLAGELGFEHHVVEGIWQKWTPEQLRELVAYSRARGVGIWVWRHRNTLGDAVQRRTLFASLRDAGVVGVKVDFLDHEAKQVIDLYQAILRDAAEHRLMINFHGANKPAGEARTWPNEMTREAIYGLEHRRAESWAAFNTTMPFVRMLAGHADYTPVVFGERRKETSIAHQVATAVVLTSPVLVYGGHPSSFLASPAAEVIKSIPSVWDETVVLPPSEIGEAAVFARRSGTRWFVAALNAAGERTITIDPSRFARGRAFTATIVQDRLDDPAALHVETRALTANGPLSIPVRAAGGFVARLTPR
jgi:alpha-glucosidase